MILTEFWGEHRAALFRQHHWTFNQVRINSGVIYDTFVVHRLTMG